MSPGLGSPPPAPIRLLRVISRLNVGGPARQVFWTARGLKAYGYETTVVAGRLPSNEDSLEDLFERDGIPVLRFPAMEREISPLRDLAAAWRFRRIIRRARPQIIHVHLSKAAFLVRAARILSPASSYPPIVYTHHGNRFRGYFSGPKTRVIRSTEKVLAPWTERFLVLSPQQRREILQEAGVGKPAQYRVVPLGTDLAFTAKLPENRGRLRAALGIGPERPLVGIVGRIAPIKTHELFVDVAASVRSAWRGGESPYFVVVGSGAEAEMRALSERVESAGLSRDFRFLGTDREPAAFLADLDVVALTSRNEGTPLSLIEAMAAGRAIVATDVGGVRDLLTREWGEDPDGDWADSAVARGLLVPYGDVAAFAAALTGLLRDRAARERMGAAGREFAARHFSLERLLRDLDRVYRELLERR